jgi:hypothetical protein
MCRALHVLQVLDEPLQATPVAVPPALERSAVAGDLPISCARLYQQIFSSCSAAIKYMYQDAVGGKAGSWVGLASAATAVQLGGSGARLSVALPLLLRNSPAEAEQRGVWRVGAGPGEARRQGVHASASAGR